MGSMIFFCIGLVFLVVMDYFNFKRPHDRGFWSLKTKGGEFKNDAWHWSKRAAICCFAVAAFGYNLMALGVCAVLAGAIQLGLYNGLIGLITRSKKVRDSYGKD